MLAYFRKTINNDNGAVAVTVGICLISLMVFIGVAIDMGRYFLVRNKILTALDSALLAAADISTLDNAKNNLGEIQDRGRQFFRANFPAGYLGTSIDDGDIVIDVDPATGSVSGDVVGATMPLVFAGIFSISPPTDGRALAPSIDINVFSEVKREIGANLEIALVLDYTPSMCFQLNTGSMFPGNPRVSDPACGKFESMKRQTVNFINQIENAINASNSDTSGAFYSYIPFSHSVRVDNSNENFNLCIDENKAKLPSIIGLRDNPDGIINEVQSSVATFEGGSNVASAMWWGLASLRPASQNLFVGSSAADKIPGTIDDVNELRVKKILLLLTDGENEYPNFDCENNFRKLSGDEQGFQRDFPADRRFGQLCEAAKAEGVTVYTIAFNVPDSPTVKTRALLTACADLDKSYNADNLEELEKVFGEIANDLIDLRVTQ